MTQASCHEKVFSKKKVILLRLYKKRKSVKNFSKGGERD